MLPKERASTSSLFSENSSKPERRVSSLSDIFWNFWSWCIFLLSTQGLSQVAFSFLWNIFLHSQKFCSNYGRFLEKKLKIWKNLIRTCWMQFELSKVEAAKRLSSVCVQKKFTNTWKDTLWIRSFWSKGKIIRANCKGLSRMAASGKAR